jgi:hypothetical protein
MTDDRRLADANLLALNGHAGQASGKLADWLAENRYHALRRLVIRGMLAELDGPSAEPEPEPEPMDAQQRALVAIAQEMDGELLPDGPKHRHRMEIKSETSTRKYIVSQRIETGEWECGCPGWKSYHGRFVDYKCKHLKAMVPALAAATRPGAMAS